MKNCSIKICFILLLFFGSVSVGAALPACPGSYNSSTWTDCVGKKVFSDQSYYYGGFKNGKWHGEGIFEKPLLKYIGQWAFTYGAQQV